MTRLLIVALVLLLATPVFSAELSSLEEQMTGAEFDRAGLEKLSKEELKFLNEWLRGKRLAAPAAPPAAPAAPAAASAGSVATTQQPAQQAPQPSGAGFEYKRKRSTIVSRIDGPFDGWDGKTQFKLENGMVWQQTAGGRWGRRTIESPEVRIEPKVGGSWRLYVEGSNRNIKVKRIK